MSKVHYQVTINAPWEKDQPLFQQVGLVTGASQGVGKGIATALFKAGCRVYITGRNIVTLEKSAKDIMSTSSRSKGEVIPMECDAAVDEATKNLFQKIFQDNNNHLDILVNNVTMNLSHTGKRNSHGAADDANDINMNLWWNRDTLEEWDVTNRVGLRSYFASSSTAAKAMIQQRRGLIVNISSFGGVRKYIGIPHGVVKTATDRMSSDMADDLAEYGVAIVSMYPGLVRTEKMLATKAGPRILKSKASETPEYTGRAIVALYLAHEHLDTHDDIMNLGWSGRTVFANECGEQFNFVDLDGHIPKDRVMASVRAEMEGQPKHWVRPGTIDSTTDRGPKGLSKVK